MDQNQIVKTEGFLSVMKSIQQTSDFVSGFEDTLVKEETTDEWKLSKQEKKRNKRRQRKGNNEKEKDE